MFNKTEVSIEECPEFHSGLSVDEAVQVGVDDLFQAKGRWWCHLLCDDFSPSGLDVLHGFAQQIGAPTRAFHDPPGQPRPHYDLTPELRLRALEAGARELDRRGLVSFLHRGRQQRSLNQDLMT